MLEEHAPRRVGEAQRSAPHLAREAREEGLGEGQDVPPATAQGRDLDGQDGEPEEEVLAELLLRHGRPQVAVGGRHQPDVDA